MKAWKKELYKYQLTPAPPKMPAQEYIEKYLANVTPYESEREELRENIEWTCDNCEDKLEKLGWEVYGNL